MWICGDWGQASPWSRDTGVKMVKGDDDVYTGELSLPKGTQFDIKILKSTVSTTSGGDNKWSAVRYRSTLNLSASHDFGEFTDNLIPNGSFDEGPVKWTPSDLIVYRNTANSQPYMAFVGGTVAASCTSDAFTIPPNQTLRLSGYVATYHPPAEGVVTIKAVTPQQQTLLEASLKTDGHGAWMQFSETFRSADVPTECRLVLSNDAVGEQYWRVGFDTLSLVSP